MARVYRKPLSKVISDTKKLRAKQAMAKEMVYCKKCGWGWETANPETCPHCGEKQQEEP